MAIHVDNSKNVNADDIKKMLINTFNRSAEKSVHEAKYDRTILATVQYCTDATLGQYKIKYQDSYFTAYSRDVDKIYSNKASVYVLVPGNDMTNRMFITGLATNDNAQQKPIVNLEMDQQYSSDSPNFITRINNDINMSSYWVTTSPNSYTRTLYKRGAVENLVSIDSNNFINYLKEFKNNYFRFGASFKTALTEDRKIGDYGLRLRLKFNGDNNFKEYEINTFNMVGSPYEFTSPVPQYSYWEVDYNEIQYIDSIEEYMIGFPAGTNPSEDFRDIFISGISLHTAYQLYNTNNDKYKVEIEALDGRFFGDPIPGTDTASVYTSLRFTGRLKIDGNYVVANADQLEIYWGKSNAVVDSVAHPKYNSYLGKGWYCLNTANRTGVNSGETIQDLRQAENSTIGQNDFGIQGQFKWNSMQTITLNQDMCPGKTSELKCVIIYENVPYSAIITVVRKDGLYILLGTEKNGIFQQENSVSFYNKQGNATLTASIFSDDRDVDTPTPHTFEGTLDGVPYTITYKWTQEDNVGVQTVFPPSSIDSYLLSSPLRRDTGNEWTSDIDNENMSDEEVEESLAACFYPSDIDAVKICEQRYSYYSKAYATHVSNGDKEHYDDPTPEEEAIATRMTRCRERKEFIEETVGNKIKQMYDATNSNERGLCVLGPSIVTGIYSSEAFDESDYRNRYQYAKINNITHQYYGTIGYDPNKTNTIYKIQASNLLNFAKFIVTAYITMPGTGGVPFTQSIETKEVMLYNVTGSGLKYDLKIKNDIQSFVYSVSGKAPTKSAGSSHPISIKPLYFELYNQDGVVIFDSEKEYNEGIDIGTLNVRWRFPAKNTLLQANYRPAASSSICVQDGDFYIVKDQGNFVYSIADSYNIDYRDNSNVILELTYDNSTVVASTSFSFVKQGELGTNGTDYYLDIDDPNYTNGYLADVLSEAKWSTFEDKIYDDNGNVTQTTKVFYPPAQRHLKDTYLYATKCYINGEDWDPAIDAPVEGNDITSPNVKYVDLRFAQGPAEIMSGNHDGGVGLAGSPTITVQANLFENGQIKGLEGGTIEWQTNDIEGYLFDIPGEGIPTEQKSKYKMTPSFLNSGAGGMERLLSIRYQHDQPPYAMKPSPITYSSGIYKQRIASNILGCGITRPIDSQVNPLTNERINRQIYGYFNVPFFYYACYAKNGNDQWENITPANLDPARHIVVVGGFDEVIYNNAGVNPVYNKQAPFKFYLFDENNNDITREVLTNNASTVVWNVSRGFTGSNPIKNLGAIPNFNSIAAGTRLLGTYCKYNNEVYKCTVDHVKGKPVEIRDANDEVIQTYSANTFVTPYWEKVDAKGMGVQSFIVEPAATYSTNAASNLFNSWVTVSVTHYVTRGGQDYKYSAQAMIPINVICNQYGSEILNDWNGKTTKVDDAYIISSKVAAGNKDLRNRFTGITIGETFYPESSTRKPETGLFGYGCPNYYREGDTNTWARTLFLDANTGRAIFGPSGATQIVLDPTIPKGDEQVWSRLSGWYMSQDYLYKPIGTGTLVNFTDLSQGQSINPDQETVGDNGNPLNQGSIGFYAPMKTKVDANTVFMWADSTHQYTYRTSNTNLINHADFCVTYGGKLIANNAKIRGHIDAESGTFGTRSQRLEINYTDGDDRHYILWHKDFYVEDLSGLNNNAGVLVHIKGDVHAQSGQFGNVGDDKDGYSNDTMFIQYTWYPWKYLNQEDPWDNDYFGPDETRGKTATYTIYHKNFHITRSGEVFMNGKMYAKEGRLGNWNIGKFRDIKKSATQGSTVTRDMIKDCCDTMCLVPGTRGDFGHIQVGFVFIEGTGDINCYSPFEDGSPGIDFNNKKWYITKEGEASFLATSGSKYAGTFYTGVSSNGSGSGSSLGANGLSLESGSSINMGGATLSIGQNGFTFSTGASFAGKLNTPGGLDLNGGSLSAGGNIEMNSSYIKFGGSRLYSSGALDMNSNQIRNADLASSTTINGTSIETYIKNLVNAAISGATVSLSVSKNTKANIPNNGYVVTNVTAGGIIPPA